MSIRLRLVSIVAATATLLVLIGGIAFEARLASGMRQTLEDSLRASAVRVLADIREHKVLLVTRRSGAAPTSDQSIVQVLSSTAGVEYTTTIAGDTSLLSVGELAKSARGTVFLQKSHSSWSNPALLLAEPVPGKAATLVVGALLDEVDDSTSRVRNELLLGGPLVVLIASAGGWLLAGQALKPVERLRVEATAISTKLPNRRLAEPKTKDEIAKLARTMNSLLDRLQGSLIHQREFVAAASHELRTPLAVLKAELEVARRPGRTPTEMRRSLDVLARRVEQLSRLSGDLLLLARGDEGAMPFQFSRERLEPLVAESLQSLREVADERGIVLVLDADSKVTAAVDGGRFQQVVDNLVSNALQHGTGTSYVEVSIREDAGWAVVEVLDEGPGLSEELLARAFERFSRIDVAVSGKNRGAGLGLAVVRMIVEAHHGTVEIRNRAEHGASVLIRLPVSPPVSRNSTNH